MGFLSVREALCRLSGCQTYPVSQASQGHLAASYGRVLSFIYTFNFVLYFLERQVAFSDSDPDYILVKA